MENENKIDCRYEKVEGSRNQPVTIQTVIIIAPTTAAATVTAVPSKMVHNMKSEGVHSPDDASQNIHVVQNEPCCSYTYKTYII